MYECMHACFCVYVCMYACMYVCMYKNRFTCLFKAGKTNATFMEQLLTKTYHVNI